MTLITVSVGMYSYIEKERNRYERTSFPVNLQTREDPTIEAKYLLHPEKCYYKLGLLCKSITKYRYLPAYTAVDLRKVGI